MVVATASYCILRRIRRHNYNPKYVPSSYLKRKWQSWTPRSKSKYGHLPIRNRHSRGVSEASYGPTPNARAADDTVAEAAAAAGVDRNTSVRSVMTLPPYSHAPRQTEEVIGREGERAGMDVVVEYPETGEEEEARREDQMESLFQIRQARRREVAEREERRQARREARARGDTQRLEELRRESRIRADSNSASLSTQLLAEHQSHSRERRVSEVAYASVGHVRHDGTRLRANSNDSERGGLLAGAAPMGERRSSSHHRNASNTSNTSATLPTISSLHTQHHNRSTSSISISTTASSAHPGVPTPPSTHRSSDPEPPNSNSSNENPSPSDSVDIAGTGIPNPLPNSAGTEPPNYDALDWGDAPPYSSPARNRESAPTLERQLAERARLAAAAGNRNSAASLERIIAERSRAAATRDAIANELHNQTQSQTQSQNQSQGGPNPNQVPARWSGSAQALSSAAASSSASASTLAPGQRTSRSSGVMRVPTLAPQLPALETLPSISVEGATEPNTPVSPNPARMDGGG